MIIGIILIIVGSFMTGVSVAKMGARYAKDEPIKGGWIAILMLGVTGWLLGLAQVLLIMGVK